MSKEEISVPPRFGDEPNPMTSHRLSSRIRLHHFLVCLLPVSWDPELSMWLRGEVWAWGEGFHHQGWPELCEVTWVFLLCSFSRAGICGREKSTLAEKPERFFWAFFFTTNVLPCCLMMPVLLGWMILLILITEHGVSLGTTCSFH